MGEAAAFYSDLTIVTSDNPRMEDPLTIIAEIEKGIDGNKIKKTDSDHLFAHRETHCYTIIPDRRKAIQTAIMEAQSQDIILIAGKGHEDYQILGTKKFSFDDRIVAAEALELRSKK
jgi:UDP-N-acetylmuramoyl-L-alanyl-D-glutamate--2,6-diaminopimelate ligase